MAPSEQAGTDDEDAIRTEKDGRKRIAHWEPVRLLLQTELWKVYAKQIALRIRETEQQGEGEELGNTADGIFDLMFDAGDARASKNA